MKWTITNNKGLLYPTTILVEGNGIDEMERNIVLKLAQKSWKRDDVVVRNSDLIYQITASEGFLELEFLIEGQTTDECQQKLNKILQAMNLSPRNIKVKKLK